MSFHWLGTQIRLLLATIFAGGGRSASLTRLQASWGKAAQRAHDFEALRKAHASRREASLDQEGVLDDRTWADLNLDDVFASINHTTSTIGQQALYHRLRTAPVAPDLQSFESLVHRLGLDASMRDRARMALAPLQDPAGYDLWWLAGADAVQPLRWYIVFPFLTAAAATSIAVAPLWPWALLTVVSNIVVRYLTDAHLLAIGQAFRQFPHVIGAAESLRDVEGKRWEPSVAALGTDVGCLRRLKTISRWTSGNPLMLSPASSRIAISTGDFINAVYEYLNLALLLDGTGVYFGVKHLQTHRRSLLNVLAAIGDVDAAISVASYRASRSDWTRPRFRPANAIANLRDLRHPLIRQAVPNSIALEPARGILITGSNMSGKSTFLRTIGVGTVMAQTLNTCLASEYDAPVMNVRSCIGRADDLLAGKSYYAMEVEILVGLVRASANPVNQLFLLDELYRGTNAVERIAAGRATLEELLGGADETKPHFVLAATHDGELVGLLSKFDPYHFGDAVGPDGLIFDHQLKSGPATSRTAIALLNLNGAPKRLLDRAIATATMLDRQRATGTSAG